ncbi:MAG: hypothetical protein LH660_06920 [Phormidesmis sp. CAN_BIN36]|nr:hypothetical protein [Phormidesmis sp. CAN_BIN36]
MKHRFYPHPSPLPKGERTRVLAPFSLGRRVGDEGSSFLPGEKGWRGLRPTS